MGLDQVLFAMSCQIAEMKPGRSVGLSLERFAHAKTSTYDKKNRKEKEFALNAKKVNKYRKLKQRLAQSGRLQPNLPSFDEEDEEQPGGPSRKKARGQTDPDMSRLLARAGPAPEEGTSSSEVEEMVGAESSDEGDAPEQPAARHAGAASSSGQHPAATLHAGRGRSVHPAPASRPHTEQQATAKPGPYSQQQQQQRHREHAAPPTAGHTGRSAPSAQQAGSPAGRLGDKHTKQKPHRQKPVSQLQRIAAKVQQQKDAEVDARERKRREIEERRERVAAAEKERKRAGKLLRKRTRQGQPVMRFRMDKILSQLQADEQPK